MIVINLQNISWCPKMSYTYFFIDAYSSFVKGPHLSPFSLDSLYLGVRREESKSLSRIIGTIYHRLFKTGAYRPLYIMAE
jgi:hypothetical protein